MRNLRARLGLLGLTDGEGFDPFERCAKNGAHSCPRRYEEEPLAAKRGLHGHPSLMRRQQMPPELLWP